MASSQAESMMASWVRTEYPSQAVTAPRMKIRIQTPVRQRKILVFFPEGLGIIGLFNYTAALDAPQPKRHHQYC